MTTNHLSKHLSDPQSICIFRLSAIGDVTHMVPVVKTLQHRFPSCKITWIVGVLEHKLLAGLPGVNFIVFNKSAGWKSIFALKKALKGQKFEVLLQMQLSLRANILSRLISAKRRIGYDEQRSKELHSWAVNERIPYVKDLHVFDGFMQFTEYLGCQEKILNWHIPVSEADELLARRIMNPDNMIKTMVGSQEASLDDVLQGKRNMNSVQQSSVHDTPNKTKVIISPCSSHELRNWSVHNYAALCDHLVRAHNAQVLLCGGPSALEADMADAIERRVVGECVNLVGKDTLGRLLSLLRLATVVISPDSGPAHLATCTDTPVLGLYAATNPRRSGPYKSIALCVDRFDVASRQFLRQPSDQLRWGAKIEKPGVMDLIDIDEVCVKLDEILSKKGR